MNVMKQARKEFSMSINDWADWFRVDPRTVRRWEDETRLPSGTAYQLLEAYRAGYRPGKTWKGVE